MFERLKIIVNLPQVLCIVVPAVKVSAIWWVLC